MQNSTSNDRERTTSRLYRARARAYTSTHAVPMQNTRARIRFPCFNARSSERASANNGSQLQILSAAYLPLLTSYARARARFLA